MQQMTPDIKERIEANKLKALEKRAAKLGVPVERLCKLEIFCAVYSLPYYFCIWEE